MAKTDKSRRTFPKSEVSASGPTTPKRSTVGRSATILKGEAAAAIMEEYVMPDWNADPRDSAVDPLGIHSALAASSTGSALLSPCYMNETHGGGGFERVPGFDVARAMTAVISPAGPVSMPDAPDMTNGSSRPESAIGADTRVAVPNTTLLPWRCVALLKLRFQSGKSGTGTGWFISGRTLATAAHNLVDQHEGAVIDMQVVPGYANGIAPFGVHKVAATRFNPAWAKSFDPELDFALIHIATNPQTGYFGFAAADDKGLKTVAAAVNVAGYPIDKAGKQYYDGGTQQYGGGRIVGADKCFIFHTIDTERGQSGAPLFWSDQKSRIGLGIHTYGVDGQHPTNRARRITPELFEAFKANTLQ